jgi:hypothetical protein
MKAGRKFRFKGNPAGARVYGRRTMVMEDERAARWTGALKILPCPICDNLPKELVWLPVANPRS